MEQELLKKELAGRKRRLKTAEAISVKRYQTT